jgi:glycosyltransferase involved in cell wall biosynthesis
MIRLLMVTHYFDSHQGGIELVARWLYDSLSHDKCKVEWAAAGVSDAPPVSANSRVLPLPTWNGVEETIGVPFPIPSLAAIRKLRAAVKRSQVVLLHDCLYLSNIAAYLLARLYSVPVIVVQHVGLVPYKNPVLRIAMKTASAMIARPMLASASKVVFISNITRNHFRAVPFRNSPLTIFNGVDTDVFRPLRSSDEKLTLRAKLGLPAEACVALFVGRFVEKKGLPILREMAQAGKNITWAFAGNGPLNPNGWNLPNTRIYSDLRGDRIAELYRASDIFILPSTGEGFPLVLQEALASGLPAVCGDETVTADPELHKVVRGVTFDPSNANESARVFANAIQESLSEPQSLEAARQRFGFVRSRYSWNRAVAEYVKIVSSLIEDSGKFPVLASSTAAMSLPQNRTGRSE